MPTDTLLTDCLCLSFTVTVYLLALSTHSAFFTTRFQFQPSSLVSLVVQWVVHVHCPSHCLIQGARSGFPNSCAVSITLVFTMFMMFMFTLRFLSARIRSIHASPTCHEASKGRGRCVKAQGPEAFSTLHWTQKCWKNGPSSHHYLSPSTMKMRPNEMSHLQLQENNWVNWAILTTNYWPPQETFIWVEKAAPASAISNEQLCPGQAIETRSLFGLVQCMVNRLTVNRLTLTCVVCWPALHGCMP